MDGGSFGLEMEKGSGLVTTEGAVMAHHRLGSSPK